MMYSSNRNGLLQKLLTHRKELCGIIGVETTEFTSQISHSITSCTDRSKRFMHINCSLMSSRNWLHCQECNASSHKAMNHILPFLPPALWRPTYPKLSDFQSTLYQKSFTYWQVLFKSFIICCRQIYTRYLSNSLSETNQYTQFHGPLFHYIKK